MHAEKVCSLVDGDVVGEGVSPGCEYVMAMQCGLRHELEFDPLATLLEVLPPTIHLPRPEIRPKKAKGATGGRAFLTEFALYIQNSKLEGVNRKGWGSLYWVRFHRVTSNRVVSAY